MALEARKENKVYKIDEASKQRYLMEGFDIYDDNNKVLEYSPLKTIRYNDHLKIVNALKKEVDALKKENEELKTKLSLFEKNEEEKAKKK